LVTTGWAYSFTRSIKFLFVVIPFSFLAPPIFRAWFYYLPGMVPHDPFDGPLALISTLSLVLGYILFVSFISTEGARTMRLQTEINLAQQIHSRLVPPIDRRTGRYEFFGRSDSSTEVGGDLLDVVEKDGRIGAFVADVSGHGVRAGVLMAMIKSAARMRLLSDDSLGGLMDDLNRVVMQVKEMDMFVTVACLQFDSGSTARFLLAGHPSILHYHKSTGQITELESNYPPTGVVANLRHIQADVAFDSGDLFVLLTDGFLEVESKNGEQFGQPRIEALIRSNAGRPLSEIFDIILKAVRAHGPQDDDQTLLLVRSL
jgi:serine phosphatase RsbU (regulator of sigma subunit)